MLTVYGFHGYQNPSLAKNIFYFSFWLWPKKKQKTQEPAKRTARRLDTLPPVTTQRMAYLLLTRVMA
jgi:hypothetical protein